MHDWMEQMDSDFKKRDRMVLHETEIAVDFLYTAIEKLHRMEDFY